MLRGLREASKNWLGRTIMALVMGLLVVSFAIWGIGDIFRGFGRYTFAKVGSTEIGIEQMRQLYRDRLQLLSRQFGRSLSLDQARALGLDRTIIRQLMAEFVLDEKVRKLRLAVSDAEVRRRIMADPTFQAPNGQFDKQRFDALLRQAGLNEQRYVFEQRRELLRRQLAGTVIGPPMAPKAMVEVADRYHNEQRTIEYVLFDRAQAGEIPAPAPEVLAAYFDDHKPLFRAPEYRKVTIVALLPTEQARWIEISDADLKKAYDERKAKFSTPERRQIQQIAFPNIEEAQAAADRIAKGEAFEAIAKERGFTEQDIDLGTVTKASLIDRVVADAAFALKEGEVSAPVKGRFSTVLLRVVKIEPEKVPPFEEVAGDLRKDLAAERAKSEMNDLYNKIEDQRLLGKPLAEVAEGLKIAARTIEIDRFGRDPSGAPVSNIPDPQRLLQAAFTAEPGVDNDPLQVEGGYVWYEIAGVTPARDRTLDEVKDQAEARWREDEVASRLKTKAEQFLDKVKAGSLTEVASADGLKVETRSEIKRDTPASPLSAQAVDAVFHTAKDGVGRATAEQPVEQIVFRVTAIEVPPVDLNSDEAKKLREQLNSNYADDVYGAYIEQIQNEIGVTINPAGLRQVVTGQNAPDDN